MFISENTKISECETPPSASECGLWDGSQKWPTIIAVYGGRSQMLVAVLEEGDGGVTERMYLCSLRMKRSSPCGLDEKGISGKNNR